MDIAIIWQDAERLVAFSYLDGQPQTSRVLEATTVTDALTETCETLRIRGASADRINQPQFAQPVGPAPVRRWT